MNILFVSRAFPPTIGGIEKQNAELGTWLSRHATVTVIANRHGKSFLPLFLPWALMRTLWLLRRHDVLLLGDGVLAPLGAVAKLVFPRKAVVSILHGLDLTFASKQSALARLYRSLNLPSLRRLDGLICVSQETKQVALSLGFPADRAFIIPNGIDPQEFEGVASRDDLARLLGMDLSGKKVIVRIGRFVPHKGTLWFIREVLPLLDDNIVFVAAGGAAQKSVPGDQSVLSECEAAVRELGLGHRVRLFPNALRSTIMLLFQTADLAVAPNIPVPGSMEGFGLIVLEAGLAHLPIVVSRLEGLQESVTDGENGFLVEPENPLAYQKKIEELLSERVDRQAIGARAARFTQDHFAWSVISSKYVDLLGDFIRSARDTH